MADLQSNLTQYRAQLDQVEAALTSEPDNEELHKLKKDLEEVINLTLDLLKVNEKGSEAVSTTNACPWKVGDKCEAVWSRDGNYYPATVDVISDDLTTCTVTFDYGNTEIVKTSSLRGSSGAAATGQKRSFTDTAEASSSSGPNKKISRKEKDEIREQKRKKMAKKQQRLKEIGEQREQEKNRWLDFFKNSKGGSSSKKSSNLKGMSKKSIFASPETLTGRVGVGTCGIGDKPMTNFAKQDKVVYKK